MVNTLGNYSDTFWSYYFSICLWENPETLISMISFGRVPEPQTQLWLSVETPGHLNKIKKIPGTCSEHIVFYSSLNLGQPCLSILEETGAAKIPPTHLDLGNGVTPFIVPDGNSAHSTPLPCTHVNPRSAKARINGLPVVKDIHHPLAIQQLLQPQHNLFHL